MKDKPDKHTQERLANVKYAAEAAGLPERIKLPSPVQLAQIAAGFGIQTQPARAVEKAVSLYLHATAFAAKHDNAPVLDVVRACDIEFASQLLGVAAFERTYLLDPDKRNDEARRELAASGLRLSAKYVLKNLHDRHRLRHMQRFLRGKGIPVTWIDGKPLRLWGTPTKSEDGDDESKLNEAHKATWRMVTRKEYDDRMEAIAKQQGWTEAEADPEWQQDLAGVTQRQADRHVVYRLPRNLLGDLIDWKRSLKSTGGVKSRRTALTKKI